MLIKYQITFYKKDPVAIKQRDLYFSILLIKAL